MDKGYLGRISTPYSEGSSTGMLWRRRRELGSPREMMWMLIHIFYIGLLDTICLGIKISGSVDNDK